MNKTELADGIFEFGAFVWNGNNEYNKAVAIKIFKSNKRAESFARPRNLVVRGLGKNGEHVLPSLKEPAHAKRKRKF